MFLFVLYLPGPDQLAYFPSNLDHFSTFALHSAEMSIRMQANLYKRLTITYKRLTITTNVLPSIRMAYDCSRICCEYAYLTNFRSRFLIFARPREYSNHLKVFVFKMNTTTSKCLFLKWIKFTFVRRQLLKNTYVDITSEWTAWANRNHVKSWSILQEDKKW